MRVRYVTSHPQYADSSAYAGRFRQLHSRALGSVRARVQAVLRHATEQARCAFLGARMYDTLHQSCFLWCAGVLGPCSR